MHQKKCPDCGTWNTNQENCENCGKTLDYWKEREQDVAEKERIKANLPKDPLEKFYDAWRYHKWLLVRMVFWVFYSIWMVIFGIISFFMMLIIWGPG